MSTICGQGPLAPGSQIWRSAASPKRRFPAPRGLLRRRFNSEGAYSRLGISKSAIRTSGDHIASKSDRTKCHRACGLSDQILGVPTPEGSDYDGSDSASALTPMLLRAFPPVDWQTNVPPLPSDLIKGNGLVRCGSFTLKLSCSFSLSALSPAKNKSVLLAFRN